VQLRHDVQIPEVTRMVGLAQSTFAVAVVVILSGLFVILLAGSFAPFEAGR